MSRPQDLYFDYNARQQHLRERDRAPSRRPKRRWPPPPSAEDESTSLAHEFRPGPPDVGGEEARSRGSLDQQPIIIDVDLPASKAKSSPRKERDISKQSTITKEGLTSSDDSSRPETPSDSGIEDEDKNRDRRYVFIPKEGVEIPLTYDEPRTPIHAKHSHNHARPAQGRGRTTVPKLDTDLPQPEPSHDVPVQLERERSPYRSAPRSKEARFSGDVLLSPELMSPTIRYADASSHPTNQAKGPSGSSANNITESSEQTTRRTSRPSMIRHSSAMAYPGQGAATPKTPTYAQADMSQLHDSTLRRCDAMRLEPDSVGSPRRSSAVPSERLSTRVIPSEHHLRQASVPPPRAVPVSTDRTWAPLGALPGLGGQQSLNAMLSSPSADGRRASPRNSPRSSPQASPSSSPLPSPSRTPPAEAGNRKFSYMEGNKTSGSSSIRTSPLHPHQSTRASDNLDNDGNYSRRPRPAIRSRQTSPLPAAARGDLDVEPAPQINIRSPSSAVHRRSSSHVDESQRSRSQYPIIQSTQAAPEGRAQTLKPGGLEQRRRSSSAVESRPRLTIDSSRDAQTTDASESRHLSLKSPTATRAASVGAPPATLPPCPRSVPVAGYNDWFSLRENSSFKFCPTCRAAVTEAGYGRHLVPAFSKPPERYVRCSFSIPWNRMAYLLMLKKRWSDVNLLYDMADVAEKAPPCTGKRPSVRDWYRIGDIDGDRSVPGFYACPYCVQSLETIFPVLKGVFHKGRSRYSTEERICSLRSDSSRFATCVDLLEDTANQANEHRRTPNTYRFVELAKSMGAIPSCSRDDMLRSKTWHVISKLPEFTVCSECYEDVVWPAILQGMSLASQFSQRPQGVGKSNEGVSCQMYSSRMRKVFKEACTEDDFEYLQRVALRRYKVERDLQNRIVEAQRLPRAQREEAMEDIVDEWQEWD
ncbi:MAG: hypothetical protein Q9201_003902 [Fulgogasparrea decipioides]